MDEEMSFVEMSASSEIDDEILAKVKILGASDSHCCFFCRLTLFT